MKREKKAAAATPVAATMLSVAGCNGETFIVPQIEAERRNADGTI
jgi:hypothetical protein